MLKKFYQSKVEEIRLKYENICNFMEHNGEKGNENELILIDFLKDFLPKSYSIGRGFIIDSEGNTSNQCDIVIYDNFYNPNLIRFNSNTYFPVESVYCVIEVKTTIRDQDMKKSFDDMTKIANLAFHQEDTTYTKGNAVWFGRTTRPNYFLFGYKSDTKIVETILKRFIKYPIETCFILNMGTLSKNKKKMQDKNMEQVKFEISYLRDLKEEQKKSILDAYNNKSDYFELNCIKYPIIEYENQQYLVDYVKNFLIFLFLVNFYITNKQISRDYLKHYFPLDKLLVLTKNLVAEEGVGGTE
ncbi:hypothetical protein HZA38_06035 [Candidatus Peregrinibacteria bacterium]|nr:hypothetical protein [Candidatus Peregrinibacteria bacterium]